MKVNDVPIEVKGERPHQKRITRKGPKSEDVEERDTHRVSPKHASCSRGQDHKPKAPPDSTTASEKATIR